MPRLQGAERTLCLVADVSRQNFVCFTCRAQATRQFHASPAHAAELPWYKRMRNRVFGSEEDREIEKKREQAQQRQLDLLAKKPADGTDPAKPLKPKWRKGYEVAPIVDPKTTRDYVQAATWAGLTHIGSEEWIKAKEDPGTKYIGFMSGKQPRLRPEQWKKLLHNVTAEVFALREAGRDVEQIYGERVSWNWTNTRNAILDLSEDRASLSIQPSSAKDDILKGVVRRPKNDETNRSGRWLQFQLKKIIEDGKFAQSDSVNADAWMGAQIDSRTRFAILKRAFQLSGHRPLDSVISSATTLSDIYRAFSGTEKPKKLARTTPLRQMHVSVPNVAVYNKRRTPIHKEQDLGRWKVIKRELKARGLPVTGSNSQGTKTKVPPRDGRELVAHQRKMLGL